MKYHKWSNLLRKYRWEVLRSAGWALLNGTDVFPEAKESYLALLVI